MGHMQSSDFSYMTATGPSSEMWQTTSNPMPVQVGTQPTGWNYVLWDVNTTVTNPVVFTYIGADVLTKVYFALSAPGGSGGGGSDVFNPGMSAVGGGGGGAGEVVQTMIAQLKQNDTFSLNSTSSNQLTLTLATGVVMNASPGQNGAGGNQTYGPGTGGNGGSNANDVGVDSGLIIVSTLAELISSTVPTAYTVGGAGGNGGYGPSWTSASTGTPGYNAQPYVYFADGTLMPSSAGGDGGNAVGGDGGNPAPGSMIIYWKTV
jgi:hypothetical protein